MYASLPRERWQRGEPAENPYPLEQEYSLEVPLGYEPAPPAPGLRIAALLHAFHIDLVAELRAYLSHIPVPADLFVTTDSAAKRSQVERCFADWRQGSVETRIVPNRGRDVAPKLTGLADVHDRYEYVLHLHTKRSGHDSRLAGWRGYLLETLLGSPAAVRSVLEVFARLPTVGMLAPQHIDALRPWVRWGQNFEVSAGLAERMGLPLPRRAPLDFPSGSMFWARTAALRPLLDLRLGFEDFPEESGQTDGTLAHAIERLHFLVCERSGFDWVKITAPDQLHDQGGVVRAETPQALRRFALRRRVRLTELRDEARAMDDAPFITVPPPKPRRILHVLWRHVLGDGPASGRLAIVAMNGAGDTLEGLRMAVGALPASACGEVLAMPARAGEMVAWRNEALRAGFATGADLVLLLGRPGWFYPGGLDALLRMNRAQGGRAVLEAARFPQEVGRHVHIETFSIDCADGPALAVPRAVYQEIGGFGERLPERSALVEFCRRARAQGFAVLQCPRALYLLTEAGEPAPAQAGR